MKKIDKRLNFLDIENECLSFWNKKDTFKFSDKKNKDPFCVMMPPPNITGSLHMGHALTFTLQDIIIRFYKKLGKNVLWQPGTDHAGIATEIIVEKKLLNEKKKNKKEIGRDEFIKRIWKWKDESGNKIIDQLKRLGTSVDWSLSRFTLDKGLSDAVNEVFIELYSKGLIYKDKRLVNWDPMLETAVSDLEVKQKEVNGKLWYIKYKIFNSNKFIVVATTRPETMFGDTAIAIDSKNKKLNHFIGQKVIIPFTKKLIPIIADKYADPKKGSGAVKITPAHDFNDFIVGKRHNLELVNIFDNNAKLNKLAPKSFVGLDRFKARKVLVDKLQKEKLLQKTVDNHMVVPVGDRSGTVIEPYLTDQWFLNSKKLCEAVENAIKNKEINFFPNSWMKTFKHWIKNIEPWCISRQIWWGHRIPVWYANDEIVAAKNYKEAKKKIKKENIKFLKQDSDVLDTWFSSALWPFSTLGWPKKNKILLKYYPTDVLITGFDIIFFWVARMIIMGLYFMKKVPFNDIYIHPLVKDERGDKMSKSKGNVIDPLNIIKLYGADALRLTLTNLSTQGRDIKLSNKLVENSRNFITKLWNVARFSQFNNFIYNKNYSPEKNKIIINQWIFSRLVDTQTKVLKNLKKYKFNLIISDLYHFIWNDFCDLYIELCKYYLKKGENEKKEISLNFSFTFKNILNLINPIIPFVTEKLSRELNYINGSLYDQEINKKKNKTINKKKILEFEKIVELIKQIRFDLDGEKNKENKISLNVFSKKKIPWVDQNFFLLKSMFNFNEIKYDNTLNGLKKSIFVVSGLKFSLLKDKNSKFQNTEFEKKINFYKNEILYFEKKLNNKNFLQKAPSKIVNQQKKKLKEAKINLKLLTEENV